MAIAASLDDHSRYVAGLQAGLGDGTNELVWSVMLAAIAECGIPSMSLADNGIIYTGKWRGFEAAFETNLRRWGRGPSTRHRFTPRPAARSNGSGRP